MCKVEYDNFLLLPRVHSDLVPEVLDHLHWDTPVASKTCFLFSFSMYRHFVYHVMLCLFLLLSPRFASISFLGGHEVPDIAISISLPSLNTSIFGCKKPFKNLSACYFEVD